MQVRNIHREAKPDSVTIKRRVYRNLYPEAFNLELTICDVNSLVIKKKTLQEADAVLYRELKFIADKHAPVRNIQQRGRYLPAMSEGSKELIRKRDSLKLLQKESSLTRWELVQVRCTFEAYGPQIWLGSSN